MPKDRVELQEADHQVITNLRAFGVLVNVEPHRLNQRDGTILVPCGDGHQMPDIFYYHSSLSQSHRLEPVIHILALNGGALLIPPHSPLSRGLPDGDVLIRHIIDGCRLKGISTAVLYSHAPCAACTAHRVSAARAIDLLVEAKRHLGRLVRRGRPLAIACFFQVDWGSRKRTYFVQEDQWVRWSAQRRL